MNDGGYIRDFGYAAVPWARTTIRGTTESLCSLYLPCTRRVASIGSLSCYPRGTSKSSTRIQQATVLDTSSGSYTPFHLLSLSLSLSLSQIRLRGIIMNMRIMRRSRPSRHYLSLLHPRCFTTPLWWLFLFVMTFRQTSYRKENDAFSKMIFQRWCHCLGSISPP